MAGMDDSFRREDKQLRFDASDEVVIGAVDEVRAPDAVVKQRIPGKDMPFTIDGDAAWVWPGVCNTVKRRLPMLIWSPSVRIRSGLGAPS